jgi:hypothetical protein
MSRPDYCPRGNEPCQALCDTPCGAVVPMGQKREDLAALVRAIKQTVHEYDGRISVTEAIGALELAKLEIYEAQK